MKIIIVALEFPYPPNHGAKVDIWNRIWAFKNAGHSVLLITWQGIKKGNIPTIEERRYVEQIVDKLIILDILRNGTRLISLFKYPSLVAARITSKKSYQKVLSESLLFSPDFIFLDGIYGALLGYKLKKELSIPLGIRLHNIESNYMRGLLFLSKGLKVKLSILAACLHLKSFEKKVIAESDAFFDISIDDLKHWTDQGFSHGFWLPSILYKKYEELTKTAFNYDVGFLGNLNTPNNVEGIKWFVNNVLPLLLIKQQNLKVLILGSEPSSEIYSICKAHKSIILVPNPYNPSVYLDQVKVLINPVKFGSGVNIKSIEMLMRHNEVVSTSTGIKGMPVKIRDVFFIADSPEEFSDSIFDILQYNKSKNSKQKHELRELFKEKSIKIVINAMKAIIQNK